MDRQKIQAVVAAALRRSGLNPYRAAVDAGLPADAIRHVVRGHEPKASRLAQICAALGLEFYVGPPRDKARALDAVSIASTSLSDLQASAQTLNRVLASAGRDPVPDDLWPVLAAQRGVEMPSLSDETTPAGLLPVQVARLAAVAGGGPDAAGEEVTGFVWFRQDWLDECKLDPVHCAVIGVVGESMEPTLPDGCSILIDRACTDWLPPRILVVRTQEGLLAKRAGHSDNGRRILVSDHPAWADTPLSSGAEIMGQVRWVARSLN